MPRNPYNTHVRWLFKQNENYVTNGQFAALTYEETGKRFLCKVTEVNRTTGSLMLGNPQTIITDKLVTLANLNFADGDLVGSESIRTDDNVGLISNMKSNLHNERGARTNRNPAKKHMFDVG